MKQLVITPELKAMLQAALGPDVEVDGFAVFESISLNDKPLPGKRGTIFHKAVVPASTLLSMVKYIEAGNTLPLMQDHDMDGEPFGRIFHAGLNYTDTAIEFRTLFYVDPTETKLIAKLNNGTYDEVSVQFLAEKILCSECGFDYRGPEATFDNLLELTCNEGHKLGEDGVHARLVGLETFLEISLVARGAADKPKIIGRSTSKLAPATEQRLAAQGFESLDGLVCRASLGEDNVDIDVNKLITDLSEARAAVSVRESTITTLTADRDAAVTAREAAEAALAEATAARETAETALADAQAADGTADRDAAIAYLSSVLKNVRIAAGKDEGSLPTTVSELTAAIDEETSKLTAILPVGGKSAGAANSDEDAGEPRSFAAFKTA